MQKSGKKLYAFVLMPFSEDFEDIYQLGIKAACNECNIYCERVDETHVLGPIYDKIINAISKADIVITDLTGKNPNVFYETGYAHALDKVTIHLCQDVAEMPFDLAGFQHIVYSGKITDLKKHLIEKLEWAQEYINTSGTEIGTISLRFFHDGTEIENIISAPIKTTYRNDGTLGQIRTEFVVDVFNSSVKESQALGPLYVYSGNDVVGISNSSSRRWEELTKPSRSDLASYAYRHAVDFRETLASSEWKTLPLSLVLREGLEPDDSGQLLIPIKLRFLTESTPLDLDLQVLGKQQLNKPTIQALIDGEENPSEIDVEMMVELNRDGSIDEAGFEIPIAVRNTISEEQEVGPLVIYTNEFVKKFDTDSRIGRFMSGKSYVPSDNPDYARKFITSEKNDVDGFGYEAGQFQFLLDEARIPKDNQTFQVPFCIVIFTNAGPLNYTFVVNVSKKYTF